jgi:hypothetical protein
LKFPVGHLGFIRLPGRRQTVHRDAAGNKHIVKETVVEHSTNFYASNLQLGSIPPLFLAQLGRSRWQIDADVFQTITTNSALKQPSLHQGYDQALLILTMIRVLAFTLTQVFYHRQIRSQFRRPELGFRDLARRIAYQFLAPRKSISGSCCSLCASRSGYIWNTVRTEARRHTV